MKRFGPTLFLRAFLLIWFEPMAGKMMLPLLGGAASVWITCLLSFQLMLLDGLRLRGKPGGLTSLALGRD